MRSFPIDTDRMQMISGGKVTPILKWVELSDGNRKPDPQGRQETDEHDRPLWRVDTFLPADEDDDRDRSSVAEVTIAAKDRPDVGSPGELLVFEGLVMSPGYLNRKTNQVTAPRWSADSVRKAHGHQKVQPAA